MSESWRKETRFPLAREARAKRMGIASFMAAVTASIRRIEKKDEWELGKRVNAQVSVIGVLIWDTMLTKITAAFFPFPSFSQSSLQ